MEALNGLIGKLESVASIKLSDLGVAKPALSAPKGTPLIDALAALSQQLAGTGQSELPIVDGAAIVGHIGFGDVVCVTEDWGLLAQPAEALRALARRFAARRPLLSSHPDCLRAYRGMPFPVVPARGALAGYAGES